MVNNLKSLRSTRILLVHRFDRASASLSTWCLVLQGTDGGLGLFIYFFFFVSFLSICILLALNVIYPGKDNEFTLSRTNLIGNASNKLLDCPYSDIQGDQRSW
jgi:hypothetical protein